MTVHSTTGDTAVPVFVTGTPPPRRIASLDGLRAIAIVMVLAAHLTSAIDFHGHVNPTVLNLVEAAGGRGVLFFFVISGFLITTLLLNEHHRTGAIDVRAFYVRRACRILPAFCALMLVVGILWALGKIRLTPFDYFPALLLLRDYAVLFASYIPKDDWFIGHTWSLGIEEQFYLLWPISVLLLKPRRAVPLAIGLILLAPVFRLVQYFAFPKLQDQIPIMMHTRIDSLMAGCLIALLIREEWFRQRLLAAYRLGFPIAAAVFLFVVSPLLANQYAGKYLLPVGWSLENASACLILLWTIDHGAGTVGRLLNTKAIVHVGVISYSLYLWQQLFLTRLNTTLTGQFPLSLLCVILAAECSYHFIEKPFLSLRDQVSAKAKVFRYGPQSSPPGPKELEPEVVAADSASPKIGG